MQQRTAAINQARPRLRHRTGKSLFLALVTAGLAAIMFACMSASAYAGYWANEAQMVGWPPGIDRDTFIYDGTPGSFMSRSLLVSPGARAFYNHYGIDNNFLTWAPTEVITPDPAEEWSDCRSRVSSGFCYETPPTYISARNIGHALTDTTIHVLHWGWDWLAIACGNWHTAHGSGIYVNANGPTPTISGVKYEDLNADGVRQDGEPGVSGVTIDLLFNGAPVTSTTTDAGGNYSFALDADRWPIGEGWYSVREEVPAGWYQSQEPGAVYVSLGESNRPITGMDFGDWRPASIQGVKWNDLNVNGIRDPGEPGISGWDFSLDGGSNTQTTDVNGAFSFTGLHPGVHSVSEITRAHWRLTSPLSGTVGGISLLSNDNADVQFGNICLGSVDAGLTDTDSGLDVPGVGVTIAEVNVPGILHNDPPLPRSISSPGSVDDLLPGTYEAEISLPDTYSTDDPDAVVRNGRWVIVKSFTVSPCGATAIRANVYRASRGKVTGGTKFNVAGGYVTNGFEFKARADRSAQGSLEHVDHAIGLNLHSNTITSVRVTGNVAVVWGWLHVGGGDYRFRLRLVDNGEPGLNDDYALTVQNGYTADNGSQTINGNVQVHPAGP